MDDATRDEQFRHDLESVRAAARRILKRDPDSAFAKHILKHVEQTEDRIAKGDASRSEVRGNP